MSDFKFKLKLAYITLCGIFVRNKGSNDPDVIASVLVDACTMRGFDMRMSAIAMAKIMAVVLKNDAVFMESIFRVIREHVKILQASDNKKAPRWN